ncbi:hypothetical protein T484DRAFT_3389001 [Baffinella frigidus]|nr:hypothetical protein T484DRAFT_3389001 [Cryptophyta sp. CCMP2293]
MVTLPAWSGKSLGWAGVAASPCCRHCCQRLFECCTGLGWYPPTSGPSVTGGAARQGVRGCARGCVR